MVRVLIKRITTIMLLLSFVAAQADQPQYGNISFPNSGSADAQASFLTGVKALHSFQFDEARIAFEEAQRIDPSFALAYWGQAMSDNHPLWRQQDGEAATIALDRLAPTFEGRLAKAPTEKEKAYLAAIELLYYSADDKLVRDFAYSDAMARMHNRWPEDNEISIFYALSLLGTVRRGDLGYRRQALAASISQQVFAENENHPGAAHFIIHSFDDPDHAILALPAAEVYAGIAPSAAHALHMPSHIFLQLGMWQGVVESNIEAYNAAVEVNSRLKLMEGREDFHTLSWLAYANLMLGQYENAEENLELALGAMNRNPDAARIEQGYLKMRGRHILETRDWQALELAAADTTEGKTANWVSVVGISAANMRDFDIAGAAHARLVTLRRQAEADGQDYQGRQIAVLEKEVQAVTMLARGDKEGAVAVAKEAAEMELNMSAPSGPPEPMKPAVELYADILLATDHNEEAQVAYMESLAWIPDRTPSLLGLATAASQNGDSETANQIYSRLREMPGANPDGPAVRAATHSLGTAGH
jgi:tetratricopeptide (TPR) repeat protein